MSMASVEKKHKLIRYESLSGELLDIFNEKYPGGEKDYFPELVRYPRGDGSYFFAVTLETSDTVYLVKFQVEVDDADDVVKWLEGEEAAEVEQVAGTAPSAGAENDSLPDDNISQYGSADDDSGSESDSD